MTAEDFADVWRSPVHGILAAPPCTHFANSGAQYWAEKDADGRTDEMLGIVDAILHIIEECEPMFWALENPMGRLPQLRPQLGDYWTFEPWWFAGYLDYPTDECYTKRTCLWGDFNRNLMKKPVDPKSNLWADGNHIMKYGGKSERTKELRSITPTGFARAFFGANP